MKAIIPVAGIGSRLRPHTHTHPKALIPIAGKPILAHIIDGLVAAGIKNFIFVIGHLGEKIQDYISSNYPKLKAQYIVQEKRQGIGHAVWLARELFFDEDEIVIALGDTIFEIDIEKFLRADTSVIATQKVDDPRKFGVIKTDRENRIISVSEKPAIPKSNQAIVGLYKFKEPRLLLEGLEDVLKQKLDTYEEYQLTDAISYMIKKGAAIKKMEVINWFDCGEKEALLRTNATLLNKKESVYDQQSLDNSIIIPPVNIAENCKIKNSIIGPEVSIGENAIIDSSIIRNSLIGPFAEITNSMLNSSIIGNDAALKGVFHSLNIGDSNEVNYE